MTSVTFAEWRVLASMAFFAPVAVGVVIWILLGGFRNAEKAKYVALDPNETDYWED